MGQIILGVIVFVLGAAVAALGLAAIGQRVDLAMLHWTKETADPDAWERSHVLIGRVYAVVGASWVFIGIVTVAAENVFVVITFLAIGAIAMLAAAFAALGMLAQAESFRG